MNTNRGFFLIIFLLVSQVVFGQVDFFLFGGPQLTTARYHVREEKQETGYKVGIAAGVGLKARFENRLYFTPSLSYNLKGYTVVLKDSAFPPAQVALNNDVMMHTMEIAPLFQIDLSGKPSHGFVRFGPVVDYAFSGTEKFDTLSTTGTPGTLKRPMNFDYIAYGRITASFNVHLGYESQQRWMVFASYSHGLGNRNNGDYGPRILHRLIGLSAGWYFCRAGY